MIDKIAKLIGWTLLFGAFIIADLSIPGRMIGIGLFALLFGYLNDETLTRLINEVIKDEESGGISTTRKPNETFPNKNIMELHGVEDKRVINNPSGILAARNPFRD